MPFTLYDASAPVIIAALTNLEAWLDKAVAGGGDETALAGAKLAEDMRPLTAQVQMASDSAKNAVARLTGVAAPSMPDTETTFAELKARCRATVAYIQSVAPSAYEGAEDRVVEMRFPNGMGYAFIGASFLTGFALPNFYFHVTTAYAILRANGVALGKPDFLAHLGRPNLGPAT